LNSDNELKIIAVSSTVPGEGKSTVSANLAAALAQMGRRVLLIDADMRNPSQQATWKILNLTGLSNVLAGMAEPENAIQHMLPNLDLISAGITPPNPIALLESHRMTHLLEEFSESYDYVIVDTPPLLLVADGLILAKVADGLLLVARPEVLNSTAAASVKATLEQSSINILGLVVNGVNVKDSHHYGYGYGYSYGYGYYRAPENLEDKISSK
jgi:capsular exopolysaccharide synthesis family protein